MIVFGENWIEAKKHGTTMYSVSSFLRRYVLVVCRFPAPIHTLKFGISANVPTYYKVVFIPFANRNANDVE